MNQYEEPERPEENSGKTDKIFMVATIVLGAIIIVLLAYLVTNIVLDKRTNDQQTVTESGQQGNTEDSQVPTEGTQQTPAVTEGSTPTQTPAVTPTEVPAQTSAPTEISADDGDSMNNLDANGEPMYIVPESSSRLLTAVDVDALNAAQLRIARNEIFARHGRIFSDPELKAYFEGKSWYRGTIQPDDFGMELLSDIEKANIELIEAYEATGGAETS